LRLRLLAWFAAGLAFLMMVLSPLAALADDTTEPAEPSSTTTSTEEPDDQAGDGETVEPPDGPYITVVLQDSANNGAPIVGVTLTVTAEDGTEVGSAVTNDDGRVIIETPERGAY